MSALLLGLGGTISMTQRADGAAVPTLDAARLAEMVEGVGTTGPGRGGVGTAKDIALVGGSEVTAAHLHDLGAAIADLGAGHDGVVVTCGTDAIEEVAAFLTWAGPLGTSVAVTGSMLPGGRADSDAAANLADAVVAACALPADHDPVVVAHGEVLLGVEAIKASGLYRQAFAAPGRGPIGHVTPEGLRRDRLPTPASGRMGLPPRPVWLPPLLTAGLDDDGHLLRMAGASAPMIVVAANGAGNVPTGVRDAIAELIADDVVVVVASRAPDAAVAPVYGYPGGGVELVATGAVLVNGLSPYRARIVAALAHAHGCRGADLVEAITAAATASPTSPCTSPH